MFGSSHRKLRPGRSGSGWLIVPATVSQEAASSERRWASMNWYELGELVVNRSINEDQTSMDDDLETRCIDPVQYRDAFQPRRAG